MALIVKAYSDAVSEGEKKMVGYYGLKRRYHGEEFEIAKEEDFSTRWMKWVKGPLSQEEPKPKEEHKAKEGKKG